MLNAMKGVLFFPDLGNINYAHKIGDGPGICLVFCRFWESKYFYSNKSNGRINIKNSDISRERVL
jgi:hypothetical protein